MWSTLTKPPHLRGTSDVSEVMIRIRGNQAGSWLPERNGAVGLRAECRAQQPILMPTTALQREAPATSGTAADLVPGCTRTRPEEFDGWVGARNYHESLGICMESTAVDISLDDVTSGVRTLQRLKSSSRRGNACLE